MVRPSVRLRHLGRRMILLIAVKELLVAQRVFHSTHLAHLLVMVVLRLGLLGRRQNRLVRDIRDADKAIGRHH